MAKRKRKKKNTPGFLSKLIGFIVALFIGERFTALRKLVMVLVPLAAIGYGVVFGMSIMERYVKNMAMEQAIALEVSFVGEKPYWATDKLIEQVNLSSKISSDDFLLDKNLVKNIWTNLQNNPWVESVTRVRKRYGGIIEIDYKLREPIAEVVRNNEIRYIDAKGVVIDYAPIQKHLVRIEGSYQAIPLPGLTIRQADILAALDILDKIKIIDDSLEKNSDKIWTELAYIDISNFEGRVNNARSHINLFTHKKTEIRWGAAIKKDIENFETEPSVKLLRLYRDYRDYGTLDISSAGIELRDHMR